MRLPAEMDCDVRAGPHLPAEIVLISYFIQKWIRGWVKAMIFLLFVLILAMTEKLEEVLIFSSLLYISGGADPEPEVILKRVLA